MKSHLKIDHGTMKSEIIKIMLDVWQYFNQLLHELKWYRGKNCFIFRCKKRLWNERLSNKLRRTEGWMSSENVTKKLIVHVSVLHPNNDKDRNLGCETSAQFVQKYEFWKCFSLLITTRTDILSQMCRIHSLALLVTEMSDEDVIGDHIIE